MYKILSFIFLMLCFLQIKAQNLKEIARNIMLKDSIPELAFAIITKDSIITKQVMGYHKITELKEEPNSNINDYFYLGSNTKAITGFIAGKLVDNKYIEWNTKFFELFPKLKKKSNEDYHNITLLDLLTHRGKIQPFRNVSDYLRLPDFKGSKQERRKKFVDYVLTLPALKSYGSYNYSNAGYSVASVMLEKVSGKSWEELCEEILKSQMGIDFIFGWPNRNKENQPFGHLKLNGKITPVKPNVEYNLSLIEPASDLSMNIENYAKFIQLNIKGLANKDNFLKFETYKFLHTAKEDYAIGWGNYIKNDNQISEHAGSDGSFFSYMQIDRKKMIGYVVIVNSGTQNAQKGVFQLINAMKSK